MNGSNSSPVTEARCGENECIRETLLQAAEQMIAAALSFQRDVAMSKGHAAAASAVDMRVAMLKCLAVNNLWSQHREDHGCE